MLIRIHGNGVIGYGSLLGCYFFLYFRRVKVKRLETEQDAGVEGGGVACLLYL